MSDNHPFCDGGSKTNETTVTQKTTKHWIWIGASVGVTLPWLALRLLHWHGEPIAVAFLSGLAIVGAAFLLSWGAEVAQMDISQSLALAFLALIAVLPEYAVDMVFAWKAGQYAGWQAGLVPGRPEFQQYAGHGSYAMANMTGANRLLIGMGWSAVVLLFWARTRQRWVHIEKEQSTEIAFLALATLWSFSIPIRREVGLLDLAVLLLLFVTYMWRASKAAHKEPELTGPPAAIALLRRSWRRLVTVGFFLWAALTILASAEPFSEGLVKTGAQLGIDEFLLVQWLAPLASEAPEFLVALLFAYRGSPSMGLGTLISSKVNQWTLLVAMIPLVYSLGAAHPTGLALDERQTEEMFLTSAQSLFALAVLLNFEMSVWEAIGLMVLFLTQLVIPAPAVRYAFGVIYLVLTLVIFVRDRSRLRNLWNLVRSSNQGPTP